MKLFIRKRTKKQTILKWLMFHLHLWFGLITAAVVFVLCITGAAVVFKTQIIELANCSKAYNKERIKNHCSIDKVIEDYRNTFGEKPARIEIPKSTKKNILAYTSGRYPTITWYDRANGEMLGETNGGYGKFISFMMRGHRRFYLNNQTGKFLISWGNIIFIVLLITGIILWFPKSNKQIKARFRLLLPRKFKPANYLIHVNWGFYSTVGLLIMAITGVFYSFRNIQNSTINLFRTSEEKTEIVSVNSEEIEGKMEALYLEILNHPDNTLPSHPVTYDKLIAKANKELDYTGNMEIVIPSASDLLINIRKTNTHNLLGAVLTDNIYFNRKGQMKRSILFKDIPLSAKMSFFIRALHSGEILGFKTQLIYFVLCLIGAWFPVSGIIMWWNRISSQKKKKQRQIIGMTAT